MSLTRIRPRVGVGLVRRWDWRIPLATPCQRQRKDEREEGDARGEADHGRPARIAGKMPAVPGEMGLQHWPPHSRNLLRASPAAARTRSGAAPPKLVRLAAERPASNTSYTAEVTAGSAACNSPSGSSARLQPKASARLTIMPVA